MNYIDVLYCLTKIEWKSNQFSKIPTGYLLQNKTDASKSRDSPCSFMCNFRSSVHATFASRNLSGNLIKQRTITRISDLWCKIWCIVLLVSINTTHEAGTIYYSDFFFFPFLFFGIGDCIAQSNNTSWFIPAMKIKSFHIFFYRKLNSYVEIIFIQTNLYRYT